MKKLIVAIFFICTQAQAQAYDIDPATGFIRGQVPDSIKRMLPPESGETRTSGDVMYPPGYGVSRSYGTLNTGASTYITSAGTYQVSRAGSTTFIIQASKSK